MYCLFSCTSRFSISLFFRTVIWVPDCIYTRVSAAFLLFYELHFIIFDCWERCSSFSWFFFIIIWLFIMLSNSLFSFCPNFNGTIVIYLLKIFAPFTFKLSAIIFLLSTFFWLYGLRWLFPAKYCRFYKFLPYICPFWISE